MSHTDATQVVIVDRVETPQLSLAFPDKTAEKLQRYLVFGALLNKTDKLSLYLEAAVKAFIISKPYLYSGMDGLLDSKAWYNKVEIIALFERVKELERLNGELKAEKSPGNRARLNGEIKRSIEKIRF